MDNIIFADKARGIYAKADGALFFTIPGQFTPIGSPFLMPTPFRIYVHSDIDPYAVVFANTGMMFVFNIQSSKCVTTVRLPPFKFIIKKIQIFDEGNVIQLTSENQVLIYRGSWIIQQEDQDELVIKAEQKSNAEYAILEDELCVACKERNLAKFKIAVEKYAVYMAQNATVDIFIANWYDFVFRAIKLSSDKGIKIMQEVIST